MSRGGSPSGEPGRAEQHLEPAQDGGVVQDLLRVDSVTRNHHEAEVPHDHLHLQQTRQTRGPETRLGSGPDPLKESDVIKSRLQPIRTPPVQMLNIYIYVYIYTYIYSRYIYIYIHTYIFIYYVHILYIYIYTVYVNHRNGIWRNARWGGATCWVGAGLHIGWGGATCWVGAGLHVAYITVLPQTRDAEGLQEVTATQEQDA